MTRRDIPFNFVNARNSFLLTILFVMQAQTMLKQFGRLELLKTVQCLWTSWRLPHVQPVFTVLSANPRRQDDADTLDTGVHSGTFIINILCILLLKKKKALCICDKRTLMERRLWYNYMHMPHSSYMYISCITYAAIIIIVRSARVRVQSS